MADIPSKGIPLRKKKFLLKDSDRSGFTYRNVELVLDNGSLVGGDEIDSPPPSKLLYPDEGGVSPGDTRTNYTSYSNPNPEPVQYLDVSSTINLRKLVDNAGNYTYIKSVILVSGSNGAVTLSSNPQISPSNQGDFLTIQGADSSVTISNGNGLRLYTSLLRIDSGTQVNFIYDSTGGVWCETSRMGPNFASQGAF